jgi:PIN domain nuclease of toxin-antitoxin system
MRLLLDTHTLLWFALNDPQLSARAMALILDPANVKLISPASYWEIAIKMSLGKYTLSVEYEEFMRNAIDLNGFHYLHIEPRHTAVLVSLPYHHKDPFDRLMIAQAMVENSPMVSADAAFDQYSINRLWLHILMILYMFLSLLNELCS